MNCTISGNSANYGGGIGIWEDENVEGIVVNSILYGNTAIEDGNEIALGYHHSGELRPTITVSYCDVEGGPTVGYDADAGRGDRPAQCVGAAHVQQAPRVDLTSGEGEGAGEQVAGLWLLFVYRYCEAEKVFYCPEIEGPLRYDGSDNKADENGVPEKIGYAYNYFPAPLEPSDRAPIYPEGVEELDCSNDITEPRAMSFYALLSDVFFRSDQMTHQERKGMNACHWDGSVQWVDLQARAILWNATMTNDDGDEVQTFDTSGSLPSRARAVADTWALISKVRR